MSLIGITLYRSGGDVLHKLFLLKPHFVVVGSGAWNDIDRIANACAPVAPLIILRDMTENLIDRVPEQVMDNMAAQASHLSYKKLAFHLLNESYRSDVPRSKSWELRAITFSQYPTVACNFSYTYDPDERYKEVAEASEYIGPHLYDGWLEEAVTPTWVDRIHTSRNYASNWLNDYRHKIISTEVGIERHPASVVRRGWHDMGIAEGVVGLRILENALHWKADGIVGACWFTGGHTERSWDSGYGMTEAMAKLWGDRGPDPNGGNVPITKADLDAAERVIREEFLNVQRRLGGASLERDKQAFEVAGNGFNTTQKQFEELAKKL